jgi:hypothetical protein
MPSCASFPILAATKITQVARRIGVNDADEPRYPNLDAKITPPHIPQFSYSTNISSNFVINHPQMKGKSLLSFLDLILEKHQFRSDSGARCSIRIVYTSRGNITCREFL